MNCKVILSVNEDVFIEYANAIKLSLEELGHDAEVVGCKIGGIPLKEGDINIVTRAFRPYHSKGVGIQIMFQSEELWHSRDSGVYDPRSNASLWHRTLEMYKDNSELPNKAGYNVHWCPYGYSSAFETDLPEVEEDIDILFFGSSNSLRDETWMEIAGHPNMKDKKMLNLQDHTYGIERDKYIMRSKIVINLKYTPRWSYPPLRALLTQCKKKMFMCHNPNGGRDPFINGKHFIEFDNVNHFAELCNEWLENNSRRKEFAINAYEDIKENHTFTEHLATALKGII